jgi:hypothetical protein
MAQENQVVEVPVPAPAALTVSVEAILKHEEFAKETYYLSERLFNDEPVPADKKPMDLLKRVSNFAVLSSDLAVCGETCVSYLPINSNSD